MSQIQSHPSVQSQLEVLKQSEKENNRRLVELQKQVRDIYLIMEEQKIQKKSLEAFQKATPPSSSPSPAPSEQIQKKFEPISPQVKALIARNVLYEGNMTWDEAISSYGVSRTSIS